MPPVHDDPHDLPHPAELLGPAALGALTSDEQADLDRHLAACSVCRTELAALTAVAARLGELDGEQALLDDLQTDPEPDAARAGRVLAAVAIDRRRAQRWQGVLAAAASVAVLAAGVVSAAALSRGSAPAVPLEAVAVQAADAAVQARADLVPHTWGVEIKLVATGLTPGRPYTVRVRTNAGDVLDAGAFLGTGEQRLSCNLNASVLRDDADSFSVLDERGAEVLTADL